MDRPRVRKPASNGVAPSLSTARKASVLPGTPGRPSKRAGAAGSAQRASRAPLKSGGTGAVARRRAALEAAPPVRPATADDAAALVAGQRRRSMGSGLELVRRLERTHTEDLDERLKIALSYVPKVSSAVMRRLGLTHTEDLQIDLDRQLRVAAAAAAAAATTRGPLRDTRTLSDELEAQIQALNQSRAGKEPVQGEGRSYSRELEALLEEAGGVY